ncbi:Rossmann-fold NAD(P)-binding domain-containing protein [Halopelagius inordinatus]|uniref:hypothetical protein n=1 Tax=Halopelagius inordinatus TaxID=553467 RepID=UPI000B8479C3|nr:hypothetical protein [Halopelagius inordinatus]
MSAVAARTLTEAGHANCAYDLTGPTALDFSEVAEIFSAVLDRRITYANPSRLAFARRMLEWGVRPSMVLFMLAEYQVTRFGLSSRTTDEVARVLGREPTAMRTFVEGHRERFETDRTR